jgi:phosphopantetheinyl transferase (holo-ACP synthase)
MLGNDVVDLADPESSRDACHARFERRVFTQAEARLLPVDPTDLQRRWILWSAKEAAFKAARRESAETAFSPARFVVDLDRSLCGSVRHGIRRWSVRVQIDGDCVHAVVSESGAFSGILSGVCRLVAAELCDPSAGVRRFAISSLATELGVATSDLRIEKVDRIPQLTLAGQAAPVAISLSHHGSYAGFACHDPRIEKIARISPRALDGEAASTTLLSSLGGSYANTVDRTPLQRSGFR